MKNYADDFDSKPGFEGYEAHELAGAFEFEVKRREDIENRLNQAMRQVREDLKDFEDGDHKGYLIHPETDEYYAFFHGIYTVPTVEQILKFASKGIKFTKVKPQASFGQKLFNKKVYKNHG